MRKALPNLGIDEVTSVQSARSVLESSGIAYLPADHLLALELLHLRAALGTAAMVLSLAEMISPEDAKSNAIALWRCHDRPPYNSRGLHMKIFPMFIKMTGKRVIICGGDA